MNKKKRAAGLYFSIFLFLLVIGFIALRFWAQEACVEHPLSFAETFNTTDFEDIANSSVAHWTNGPPPDLPGYVSLNRIGAEFMVRNPAYFPGWINTVAVGDFDNDGWTDFIGTSSSFSNALVFIENLGAIGLVGNFGVTYNIDGTVCPLYPAGGDPTRGVKGAAIDNDSMDGSEHCGITAED